MLMKTVFDIKTGTTLIVIGFFGLITTLYIYTDVNLVLKLVFLTLELFGAAIIIRDRIVKNEKRKLILPLFSLGLTMVILLVYLLFLMP